MDEFSIFPVSTTINSKGRLSIAGHDLVEIAETYGTPVYLYDGATVRAQIERLSLLFKRYYPGEAMLAYASKAYLSYQFAQKLARWGVGLDVVSLGEIHIAQKAGFPPSVVHLHGNNKTESELQAAIEWGIQAIVVDNLDELEILEQLAARSQKRVRIWLRITPDLSVNTHPHIETAHVDSKFGLHLENGEAEEALNRSLSSPWFDLSGLHTHLGSQIFDPEPYRQAIEMLCEFAARNHFIPPEISPGGGWGVRYTTDDPSDDVEPWVRTVSGAVQEAAIRYDWPYPRLVLETGRWLVARAGVALYRVGSQKTTPAGTHIVAIDGGLADNPRVALYQARYTAKVAERPTDPATQTVRIVGKFCESGDVLIPKTQLPPVKRGEHLAVPVSGAYQLSMASNYNFAARPPVLWLEEGQIEIIQCCEQPDQPGWWVYTAESR
ncbi:MAG: diaminopimelate decarboxylase [Chloroflexota bacterium]